MELTRKELYDLVWAEPMATIPKLSCNALAIGAKQLVVQEAPEITVSVPSRMLSFTCLLYTSRCV